MLEVVGNNAVISSLHVNGDWIGLLRASEEMNNCFSEVVL